MHGLHCCIYKLTSSGLLPLSMLLDGIDQPHYVLMLCYTYIMYYLGNTTVQER